MSTAMRSFGYGLAAMLLCSITIWGYQKIKDLVKQIRKKQKNKKDSS